MDKSYYVTDILFSNKILQLCMDRLGILTFKTFTLSSSKVALK